MPADDSAAGLLAALSAEDRDAVLRGDRVLTFAEERTPDGQGVNYRAISVGVLPHSPRAVRGLLEHTGAYAAWIPLSPTYKAVRVNGNRTVACDVGRSSARKARETLTYDVEHSGDGTTWWLASSKKALKSGSSLAWEIVPHPDDPERSLVIHRQTGRLSGKGRLSNYLDSTDKQGRNRYWKDANKHARRIHWAMDAALTHPPGRDREALYLDRYAAEFGGGLPYWAK